MTSLDPGTPSHEPSPEQRRKAGRMVWLIVLGLPTLIGVMVAYLSVKGRVVRDYGHEVLVAAQARPLPASTSGSLPCREFVPKPLPSGALSCDVQFVSGQAEVVIKVEGERQYRVNH